MKRALKSEADIEVYKGKIAYKIGILGLIRDAIERN
jgi:hypothetical protein